jgi:tellurite resistance protein
MTEIAVTGQGTGTSSETHETRQEGVRQRDRELSQLRDAAKQMGVEKLRDGSWFRRIVAQHVKKHGATITKEHWDVKYPGLDVEERARRQIAGVARRASATGVAASFGALSGELLSLFSEGLAAPVGIPATITSMALEAGYTALLQIDLVCDLASIYGAPFDPDDVGEVATLFGLALEIDVKEKKKERTGHGEPREARSDGLTEKLMELEDGDIGKRIGRKLLEDSVVKNILPFLSIGIAARWNYVGTKKIAAAARKYIRYRRALEQTIAKLKLTTVTDPAVLIEGAWLLATVDGEAGHEEVMAIAYMMDLLPEEQRKAIELDKTLGDDEEQWFEDLAKVPDAMHDALLDVLYLVAATDREIEASERRFLKRVGKALKREIDFDRIEKICDHLACGEALPHDFLHCH